MLEGWVVAGTGEVEERAGRMAIGGYHGVVWGSLWVCRLVGGSGFVGYVTCGGDWSNLLSAAGSVGIAGCAVGCLV